MLKTGILSTGYKSDDKYKINFKELANDGYSCMDYQDFIPPNGYMYRFSDSELSAYLAGLKKESQSYGVKINQMHSVWQADDSTKENFEKSFDKRVKALVGANVLECPYVVYHVSCYPSGWDCDEKDDEREKYNLEMFSELTVLAKKYGTVICLENLPFNNCVANTGKKLREFIDKIDSPYFKACLDTGHINIVHDGTIEQEIKTLGSALKVLHVHDNDGNSDRHQFPFTGTVDWAGFKKGLKEIGFSGVISLETSAPINDVSGRKELSETAKRLADI